MEAARRFALAVLVTCLALIVAGCGMSGLTKPPATPTNGHRVVLTQHDSAAALIAVAGDASAGKSLRWLIPATAQPLETIEVVQPGDPPGTIVASTVPPPVSLRVAGKPVPPDGAETSFQQASYQKRLSQWHEQISAGLRSVATGTTSAVSAWERRLHLLQRLAQLAGTHAGRSNLAAECSLAAGTFADLEQDGTNFGSHRLLVLYTGELSGAVPAGELTGDEAIVIDASLPGAAAASAAQARMLAAGASQAAVLGPENAAGRVAALVRSDLGRPVTSDALSVPILFANNSSALTPAAVRSIARLVAPLRRPGSTALISGFASTPGTARANYLLSFARASVVARYLEAWKIPASALVIIGHGAGDLAAPGPSGANRRVLVVIQEAGG
jgi:outer membrane protein OmpA-like peptidoglycan-associated protein